ncbi:hypothetical protein [Burkholderia cepacia]|uniref:hypothetical protein n=1 Tax=Burkholderia cepacia TaxID=292 RepID=UPI001CF5154B|nr:hypothetical protein [Burkholderia cepacia]MCA8075358.1 hypothetical protein [Burkholderia cepacia]
MKPRAEYKNEVKTRLRDRVYDALQIYKQVHGIDSDSAALNRVVEVALFGAVGTLPAQLVGVSADTGHIVPKVRT